MPVLAILLENNNILKNLITEERNLEVGGKYLLLSHNVFHCDRLLATYLKGKHSSGISITQCKTRYRAPYSPYTKYTSNLITGLYKPPLFESSHHCTDLFIYNDKTLDDAA